MPGWWLAAGLGGLGGVQGGEHGLDRNAAAGHQLATTAPKRPRERRRPAVLKDQDPGRAAGLQRGAGLVQVVSFKQPSAEELDHNFLWRIAKAAPERGRIGIFNRSHYEEIVALRVHPEWLDKQKLPPGPRDGRFWQERHEDINAFERHLDRNGTKIVKFFLYVSKDQQKRRFLARLDNPDKQWKFSAADVAERAHWDRYMAGYDEAITATSTPWAPWHVIPADHKWLTQALVAAILVDSIRSLDLRWPEVSAQQRETNAAARRLLEEEPSLTTSG